MLETQLFMDTWTDRLVENIISPHCGAEENLDGAASSLVRLHVWVDQESTSFKAQISRYKLEDMLLKTVTGGRQSCLNGVRRLLF